MKAAEVEVFCRACTDFIPVSKLESHVHTTPAQRKEAAAQKTPAASKSKPVKSAKKKHTIADFLNPPKSKK